MTDSAKRKLSYRNSSSRNTSATAAANTCDQAAERDLLLLVQAAQLVIDALGQHVRAGP